MKNLDLIYVIEDDEIGSYLINRAIEEHPNFGKCSFFKNGQKAIEQLRKDIEKGNSLPNIIFLDITMSVMDGWEFLAEFSEQLGVSDIPIVILTSSINGNDISKANNNPHVISYISKPLDFDKLQQIAEAANS